MTGDQSRLLKVGDGVCWGATMSDLGTVVRTSWNEVIIDWYEHDFNPTQRHGAG